jgi:hypothetical protein
MGGILFLFCDRVIIFSNSWTGNPASNWTLSFSGNINMIASGEPGYHIIDFYPGIYRGKQQQPDIYLAPQLTYTEDHPGSAIPAIRLGFEVTNP